MNDKLSSEDRREVRTSLIATLAVFFTLLIGTLDHLSALDKPFAEQVAWASANESGAEQEAPAISAAAAVPASTDTGAADVADVDPGCGSAEPCVTQAP